MAQQEQPDSKTDDSPHAGGRPLKFQTVEELDRAIQNYFAKCDPHEEKALVETGRDSKGNMLHDARNVLTEQKPYTLTGLARAIGVNRGTILNYSKKAEYFSTIEAARERCAEYAESQLFGPYSNGAKFALSNNYSTEDAEWTDKKSVDHTTKGQPMPLLGGTVALPDADDEGAEDDDTTES